MRALVSFALYERVDMGKLAHDITEDGRPPSLVADSGAFTAFTQGLEVTPRLYAAWLSRWMHLFDYAITLDVIGNAEASWRSHHEAEDVLGKALVPVVHYGEPMSVFDRYRNEGYDFIAVGGLAFAQRRAVGVRMRWLVPVHRWAQANGVGLHGLGIGAFQQMYVLPWHSVDASTWGAGYRYGRHRLFDHHQGKMLELREDRQQMYGERAVRLLRELGVRADLLGLETHHWTSATIAADSFRRAEAWIRQRRGVRAAPLGPNFHARDDGTGLRVYLVDVDENRLRCIPTAAMRAAAATHTKEKPWKPVPAVS